MTGYLASIPMAPLPFRLEPLAGHEFGGLAISGRF